MNKEYVFIGNAQNKTRDFISQIIKENKDLQHQLEEKQKVIDEAIEYIRKNTIVNTIFQENENELLKILESDKNGMDS